MKFFKPIDFSADDCHVEVVNYIDIANKKIEHQPIIYGKQSPDGTIIWDVEKEEATHQANIVNIGLIK